MNYKYDIIMDLTYKFITTVDVENKLYHIYWLDCIKSYKMVISSVEEDKEKEEKYNQGIDTLESFSHISEEIQPFLNEYLNK